MLRKSKVCYSLKLVESPNKSIDRTKAVTQHFLEKALILRNYKQKEKSEDTKMSLAS